MTDDRITALAEALEGQNLWHGRYATSPAGTATPAAILAALDADPRIVITTRDGLAAALREWRKVYADPDDPDRWYTDSADAIIAALRAKP